MVGLRHRDWALPPWAITSAIACAVAAGCGFDATVMVSPIDAASLLPQADASASAADANRELAGDAGPQADASSTDAVGTLRSARLVGELDMDGELDPQWQALNFQTFAMADAVQLEAIPTYQADASVQFASLYSDDKLYFFFQVSDDLLVDDSADIYNDDSIEIYIDGLFDGLGPYAGDDHWILVGSSATYQSLGPNNISISGSIVTTPAGYNIEISMDRSDIGAGTAEVFGFNLGLNDDDDGGSSAVDAYGLWFLPDTPACPTCCNSTSYAWCDTTRLGRLELLP